MPTYETSTTTYWSMPTLQLIDEFNSAWEEVIDTVKDETIKQNLVAMGGSVVNRLTVFTEITGGSGSSKF